jgi:hypothetical protein
VTRTGSRWIGWTVALLLVVAVVLVGRGYTPDDQPFVPRSEDEIVEQLTGGDPADGGNAPAVDAALRELERKLAQAPNDVGLMCQVARARIANHRRTGDARELSYAEAALGAHWGAEDPPPSLRLLRASIRQARHEFAAARTELEPLRTHDDVAMRREAWLQLFGIEMATGELRAAKAACVVLGGIAPPAVLATCSAHIEGVTGHAPEARDRLAVFLSAPGAAPEYAAWSRSVLGEVALYAGDFATARRELRRSLELEADHYTRGLLADVLLDAGDAQGVLAMISADEPSPGLLLRRAIAQRRLGAPEARVLGDRLRAADALHDRERARRALALDDDPTAALAAAARSFEQQREPWDARVLFESAAFVARLPGQGAAARAAAAPAVTWLRETGCGWPTLLGAQRSLEEAPR